MPPRRAPSAARVTSPRFQTVAELVECLGGIPAERIRMTPLPGTATEADQGTAPKPVCELLDGTLVERHTSSLASYVGGMVSVTLGNHVAANDLGVVLGGNGGIRLGPGLVRAASVTFIPWESFPDGEFPDEAFWTVAPGLVVEVPSPTNTTQEIDRKLAEFFAAGCKLAWVIDPPTKTAKVYTSAKRFKVLDGGRVLPGFAVPLADLFARPTKPKRKGR